VFCGDLDIFIYSLFFPAAARRTRFSTGSQKIFSNIIKVRKKSSKNQSEKGGSN